MAGMPGHSCIPGYGISMSEDVFEIAALQHCGQEDGYEQ